MAKPDPPPIDCPAPPRPRRRPPHLPRASPAPSAAVLSLLAGFVSSSPVAAASPTPLPFLCPSLAAPLPNSPAIQPPSPAPGPRSRSRRSIPLSGRGRNLPYKFEQGEDGVWRPVDTYSLYGSTVCPKTCREPTNAVSADEVATFPNTTDSIELKSTLPEGWLTPNMRSENRTTLILVLSLVLAFFICFFIIGCMVWRKTLRRCHKADDVEMRARRKRTSTSAMSSSSQAQREEQRKVKGKQKIWARATSRWKDHARYTVRLRRGKRPANNRSQLLDSSTTLHPSSHIETPTDDISSTASVTPSASRSASRRPSVASLRDSPQPSFQLPQETTDSPQNTPPISVDPAPDVPSSPPAYRRGTLLTPVALPAEGLSVPDEHRTSALQASSSHTSCTSFDASSSGAKYSHHTRELGPSNSAVHAAHVATDDKALLARLADFAERPPVDAPDHAESSHQISVPVWEDEQLSDFMRVAESSDADTPGSSSHCPFPPPPSKGKMAEASYYAYRSSFEKFSDSIDPELEPSAPPFEAPSAPGLDDMGMLPSAPPLADDGFPLEGFPIDAPTFHTTAEGDASQSPTADSEGSTEHQSPASLRPLSGGTLPGYHP